MPSLRLLQESRIGRPCLPAAPDGAPVHRRRGRLVRFAARWRQMPGSQGTGRLHRSAAACACRYSGTEARQGVGNGDEVDSPKGKSPAPCGTGLAEAANRCCLRACWPSEKARPLAGSEWSEPQAQPGQVLPWLRAGGQQAFSLLSWQPAFSPFWRQAASWLPACGLRTFWPQSFSPTPSWRAPGGLRSSSRLPSSPEPSSPPTSSQPDASPPTSSPVTSWLLPFSQEPSSQLTFSLPDASQRLS